MPGLVDSLGRRTRCLPRLLSSAARGSWRRFGEQHGRSGLGSRCCEVHWHVFCGDLLRAVCLCVGTFFGERGGGRAPVQTHTMEATPMPLCVAQGVEAAYRVRGGRRGGQEWVRKRGTRERQQTGGGATQTHSTPEPHQEGRGRAQHTRRRGAARQERQPGQGTRMDGMGERAHGRQRQQRGWPGQPAPEQGNPCSTGITGGGVSRSPDGLFAKQGWEATRGRPAVRGKGTYGGRSGQRVEEQGTWASRTQKHSEAGYGRPVDRGVWTAKTVKRPLQQPAQPHYANYWAPLTRKRHTMPHPAQPRHANHWAPRTRKRHQQEHRPQRPSERSNPTQHAKGRTGDCPGPRKGATTRQNVTQGGDGGSSADTYNRGHSHALRCSGGRGSFAYTCLCLYNTCLFLDHIRHPPMYNLYVAPSPVTPSHVQTTYTTFPCTKYHIQPLHSTLPCTDCIYHI